jgi:hypothetical protein
VRQPENRFYIRNARAVLDGADPALRNTAQSREFHLRQPTLFAQFAHTLTEQSSDRGSYWHLCAFVLTNRVSRYIRFTISKEYPTMLESELISRIRHIFLQPWPHVSIMQAEGLLGWSRRQMSEAIENGEVELGPTPLGKWFPRAEMMAKALEVWPLHVIEEALGDDADGILPQAIRSAELRVRPADEKAYPQMTQIERRWRTVLSAYICVICGLSSPDISAAHPASA